MSHFAVGVITKDLDMKEIEKALMPYHEFECTGINEYIEDVDITQETLDEYKEQEGDRSYVEFLDYWYGLGEDKTITNIDQLKLDDTHRWGYVVKNDDEVVKVVRRTNPNYKWDWWVIGGRYSNKIRTTKGNVDYAKISDIDFSGDNEEYKRAARYWEVVVEDSELLDHEEKPDFFNFYKKEYYLERFGSKEKYAKELSMFSTWAIVTPEGKWFEKGGMGWWGINDSTSESSQDFKITFDHMMEKYKDYYLTIVDCHI